MDLSIPEKEMLSERSKILFNSRSRFSDFEGLCKDGGAERIVAGLKA